MAYATIDEVQGRMPQFTLDGQSKPTKAQADSLREGLEADLNGFLSGIGYVIPITGAESLKIVKSLEIYGSIWWILEARAAAVGTDAAIASAKRAREFYDSRLTALADADNPFELPDAETTIVMEDKNAAVLAGEFGECDEDAAAGSCNSCTRATMSQKF